MKELKADVTWYVASAFVPEKTGLPSEERATLGVTCYAAPMLFLGVSHGARSRPDLSSVFHPVSVG